MLNKAVLGEIYGKLKKSDFGVLSYKEHKIYYEAGPRNQKNIPGQATVEIRKKDRYNENWNKTSGVERFNLKFE